MLLCWNGCNGKEDLFSEFMIMLLNFAQKARDRLMTSASVLRGKEAMPLNETTGQNLHTDT